MLGNLPLFFDVDWPEPQYGVFGHPALPRLRRAAPLRVDVRKRRTDGHDKEFRAALSGREYRIMERQLVI